MVFRVATRVLQQARKAGVRQRLEGSFSPGQPVFLAVGKN